MDRDLVKSYMRFLNQASEPELLKERSRLLDLSGDITSAVPELKWMLKKLEEELDARIQCRRLADRRRKAQAGHAA
ncbi:MAG: hypothetical protein DI596_01980 [Azospira oryzae]|nr:MAG: hypothetical protein DI596_01980 [Azospira oryzae]PZP82389.1 MAG: hypothetical protein DI593_01980 [Azospira oryzae]